MLTNPRALAASWGVLVLLVACGPQNETVTTAGGRGSSIDTSALGAPVCRNPVDPNGSRPGSAEVVKQTSGTGAQLVEWLRLRHEGAAPINARPQLRDVTPDEVVSVCVFRMAEPLAPPGPPELSQTPADGLQVVVRTDGSTVTTGIGPLSNVLADTPDQLPTPPG